MVPSLVKLLSLRILIIALKEHFKVSLFVYEMGAPAVSKDIRYLIIEKYIVCVGIKSIDA